MQLFVQILPFLILPFLFPVVAPALRLYALLLLVFLSAYHLYCDIKNSHSAKAYESAFFLLLLAGVGLLEIFTLSMGFTTRVWPSLLGGFLAFYCLRNLQIPITLGLWSFCAILWLIVLLAPHTYSLLPNQSFHELIVTPISSELASNEISSSSALHPSQAILAPPPNSFEIIFHAALVTATSLCFFTIFQRKSFNQSWLSSIFLCVWCILLLFLAGKAGFVFIGANFLLFMLLCTGVGFLQNSKNLLAFSLIMLFLVLGYFFDFSLIFYRLMPPDALFQFIDRPVKPIALLGILSEGFYHYSYSSFWTFCISAIIIGMILYPAIRGAIQNEIDSASVSLVLSLFFFLSLLGFSFQHSPSLMTFLAHPLSWLALIIIWNTAVSQNVTASKRMASFPYIHFLPYVHAGIFLILAVLGIHYTMKDSYAQSYLEQFALAATKEEKLQAAEKAFDWGKYRGDCAAVYAAVKLQQTAQEEVLLSEDEIRRIEAAFFISWRSGYAPLLAYQSLSEVYAKNNQKEESIQILRIASQRYPGLLPLKEMLADRMVEFNQRNKAVTVYKKCINLDPSSPRLRQKLGKLYRMLDRNEDYQRVRQALLTLDPASTIP